MTKVLVAPDSFKGSMDASSVAEAIRSGWLSARRDDCVRLLPQADGGEGTLDALEASHPGSERIAVGSVTGPDGRPVEGEWLRLPDGTAVIEMASVSGLPMMARHDPLGATSRGLGEVMAHAIDAGASKLIVGIGGSASTDGGAPVLDALAARRPPAGGATVLSDVTNPLLGSNGAAAVFGPQKGASEEDVRTLEERLRVWSEQVRSRPGTADANPGSPGAGAAGGVGFALLAWGARIESGSSAIAECTGLTEATASADLVITGEGRFDNQSRDGKVVGNALQLAEKHNADCIVIAGAVDADPGCPVYSLSEIAGSAASALEDPGHWLRAAARAAAAAY
ncbi:MAG TPA: glycerate kinase [Candidatus Agrococcus pullicola]|uniref:Glycerate kinase n=1 Tax=Candidatus Agrococcus pullicola TaxID=2838429 RepID=A0A9D1YTH2_9MICO|nr:glycerate kinase [Candidatus Agrococcus pullicola]